MTQLQILLEELNRIEEGESECTFDIIYEKVRNRIFMALLDDSMNVLEYGDKEKALQRLQDYSHLKLKGAEANCMDMVRRILGDAKKIKVFYIDLGYNNYDLYMVISDDHPIVNPENNRKCEGLFVNSIDRLREDEAAITTSFIILSNDNHSFRDENRAHVISHEICHLVLNYMKDKELLSKRYLDNWSMEKEEFLCDFLPFYHLKERDYLCNFLDYGKKWFKDSLLDKYRGYVKEIVLYMNSVK